MTDKEVAVVGAAEGLEAQDAIPPSPSTPTQKGTHHDSTMSSPSSSMDAVNDEAKGSTDGVTRADAPPLKRAESQAEKFSTFRIFVIMFSLCMALFLAALDVTIITTALPTIAGHFQASSSAYTWVGSAYLLANAATTPIWGKLSDIWGRKPALIMANAVFMIGSLIAALSTSIGMLVGARVIQGIGGGGLVILVNICISDLFSMRERAKYYGIVGMTWAVASGVGPVIGGVFTEKVSWRWCFYINLPLDGVSLILLIFFLKLETPKTPFIAGIKAIDWIGVLTIVGGVVCFLYGMESGGLNHPWDSAFVLCLIIFGIVLVGLFFINEWKLAKYPITPLRLFADHSNIAAFGVCMCHGIVFIGESYYLPLYFQTVLSATPILSGVYLFALVIPMSIGSAGTGIFIKKTGNYLIPIYFATTLLTLGTGLLIDLDPYANWPKIIIYQIIVGFGIGPLFQSPLIALQSHLKGYDIAVGTATFGFVRNIATSIGVVLGGVIFQNELSKKRGALVAALGPQLAEQFASSSFGSTTEELRALPPAQKRALNLAYTQSLKVMWIFFTVVAAVGIVIACFITKKELSKDHEKVKTGIEEQERVRKEEKELKRKSKMESSGTKGVVDEKV